MSLVLSEFRLAVVQLQVTSVKADNLSRARRLVKEAAGQGSKVVLLPVRIVTGGGPGCHAVTAVQGAPQYGLSRCEPRMRERGELATATPLKTTRRTLIKLICYVKS